jgi:putative sigma-54 modulation protein
MEVQQRMNITITGRHMDMTDALKSYVEGGLGKLKTHFDKVIDADVVLSVEKHRHIAEINLHANGIRIHSKESSSDMYASVDAVLSKLDRQVKRFKDKINSHKPRIAKEDQDYGHQIIEVDHGFEAGTEIQVLHKVVLREKIPLKPMTVEEAAMQLDLVDDDFLVFSNAETQHVNVMYAREDGTYGLIEPQF